MKKMSLFLAKPVQQKMESDATFAALPGFHKAIRLPSELLESVLNYNLYYLKGSYDESVRYAKTIGGRGWKCFHIACCEYRNVQEAVHKAQRIESTITLVERFLRLDIAFYSKSEKNLFYSVHFYVELDTAEVVWSGSLIPAHQDSE